MKAEFKKAIWKEALFDNKNGRFLKFIFIPVKAISSHRIQDCDSKNNTIREYLVEDKNGKKMVLNESKIFIEGNYES